MKVLMKSFVLTVTIFALMAAIFSGSEASAESNANRVADSLATLFVVCYVDGEVYGVRGGTGIFVGLPGTAGKYILSSKFVTEGYSDWPEDCEKGIFMMEGEEYVYIDNRNLKVLSEEYDLSLITLPEPVESFHSISMEAGTELEEDETVYIVGYDGESVTSVRGQVQNWYSYGSDSADMFDIDADPTSEQWGGPIVTEDGITVGICIGSYYDNNENLISVAVGGDYVDQILHDEGVYDADRLADDSGYILGAWGDAVSTRASAITQQPAFYTNHPIHNCTSITVEFEITEYTGYPFDLWYLDLRGLDGNWIHAGSFKVDESTVGQMKEFVISFDEPVSFDAITVVSSSKWNSYTLSSVVNYKDLQTT